MIDFKKAVITILLSVALIAVDGNHKTYGESNNEINKQVTCLADNIYFEARGESNISQRAVANVVMNRVNSGYFPSTVCEVVRQKDENTCQFSWWCNKKLKNKAKKRKVDKDLYNKIFILATDIYLNYNQHADITKGALYFHVRRLSKKQIGVRKLQMTTKIGQHVFYMLKV